MGGKYVPSPVVVGTGGPGVPGWFIPAPKRAPPPPPPGEPSEYISPSNTRDPSRSKYTILLGKNQSLHFGFTQYRVLV